MVFFKKAPACAARLRGNCQPASLETDQLRIGYVLVYSIEWIV